MPPGPPPTWTVEQAAAMWAAAGLPLHPDPAEATRRLTLIIRGLGWHPSGETRSGAKGGRGKAVYPAADFQRLHRDLAGWITRDTS
jgi:hypothetical protein